MANAHESFRRFHSMRSRRFSDRIVPFLASNVCIIIIIIKGGARQIRFEKIPFSWNRDKETHRFLKLHGFHYFPWAKL